MEDALAIAESLNYSDPGSVSKAITQVKGYFMVFEPRVDSRDSKHLICLSGNLPVPRIAKTVPIQIWLPLDFPRKRPLVTVTVKATDLVNPRAHVDSKGTVKHVYLNEWEKHFRLKDLLQMLVTEFSDVFPVFDFRHFNLPTKAKDRVLDVMRRHPRLVLSWAKHQNRDSETVQLKLEGFLERKGDYDYRIQIWLFVGFPHTPPDVYVLPGDGCVLAQTLYLYKSGKVKHNLLKNWEYPDSNLIALLDDLQCLFSDNSPVRPLARYDKPAEKKKLKQANSFLDKVKLRKPLTKAQPKHHLKPVEEAHVSPTPAPAPAPVLATRLPKKPIRCDSKEVREFAHSAGLSENTTQVLLSKGFTTVKAILSMREEDLPELGLPMAEYCLIREVLKEKSAVQDKTPTDKSDEHENRSFKKSEYVEGLFGRAMHRLLEPFIVTDKQLTVGEEIGKGEYGVVYKGVLRLKENSPPEDVAIKTVGHRVESGQDDLYYEDFCQEILQLRMLNHPNIVCLKALAMLGGRPHMVLPYMANGDLRGYISNPEMDLTVEDLLRMGLHVARGMKYLSDNSFVHGDLAARNCLVDHDGTVKVGDFGLAKQLHLSEYYKMEPEKSRPLRWMAPEALTENKCTLKSDVWSFGILMWELMTRGQRPYPEVSNTMLLPGMIVKGYRMPCPAYTPQEIYEMMLFCWEADHRNRPDFDVIVHWFEMILSGEDEECQPADEDEDSGASCESSSSSAAAAASLSTDAGRIHTGKRTPQRSLPSLPPKEPTDGRNMPRGEHDSVVEDDLSDAVPDRSHPRKRPVTLMPPVNTTSNKNLNDRNSV